MQQSQAEPPSVTEVAVPEPQVVSTTPIEVQSNVVEPAVSPVVMPTSLEPQVSFKNKCFVIYQHQNILKLIYLINIFF